MAIKECDVFLSFRGETRLNFTRKLFKELESKGFQPFMDCENIHLGDEIHATIKTAIKYSKSAIVILSEEFASSKHCLNEYELVLILERNRTSKYFIIPIFYYVDIDDVKHQSGKFGAAFEQIKQQHQDDKVKEWITALASIGGILGKDITEQNELTETTVIEEHILPTFEQKFYNHYPTSLQRNQVMPPPPTTSTLVNIDESQAAAAAIRVLVTGSSRSKKGWKSNCIRCACASISTCVGASISTVIILIIFFLILYSALVRQ